MGELLRAEDVSVQYPAAAEPHVKQVSIAVGPGQRVLLLGPSGSGKSTLLRTIAGVVPQTIEAEVTGELSVCGADPRQVPVPELAARVATLGQDPADQLCLPTVADEVAFALENRAVSAAQIPGRVAAALRAVGGSHLAGRRTSELSGGEGQRVALAAALVADPELLLLDEPTALLDPAGAGAIGALLQQLPGAGLLIEHRLDELGTLPPYCLVLDKHGQVAAEGPTGSVLAGDEAAATGSWLPATAEVGRALGSPITGADLPEALLALAERGASATARSDSPPAHGSGPCAAPTGPGEALIEARNARVRRGRDVVLDGVDCQIHSGQITAVVGTNGSGKSSLVLAMAGLLVSEGIDVRASAGMVFQNPEHQFLTRTVAEEIEYGLTGPRDRRRAVAAEALSEYSLDGLAGADPFRLSGGQQRRLSLAAMTVMGDDILLADEPTFGQDRRTTAAIAARLQHLAATGRAVVLVSHDLRLVAQLADQILVLHEGRMLASGTPDEVLTGSVLDRAHLRLPPLLRAWPGPMSQLRHVIRSLDDDALAVPA